MQWPEVTCGIIHQVLDVHVNQDCSIEGFCFSHQAVPTELDNMPDCLDAGIDWLVEHDIDPVINEVLSKLSGEIVDGDVSPGSKYLWKEWKHLSVISGQLMRNRTCNGRTQW